VTLKEVGFVRISTGFNQTKGDIFILLNYNILLQLQDNNSKVKTEFLLTGIY